MDVFHDKIHEALGVLDEVITWSGLCKTEGVSPGAIDMISDMQGIIFDMQAYLNALITNCRDYNIDWKQYSENISHHIQATQDILPEYHGIVIPGGHKSAAMLHLTKSICHRAARRTGDLTEFLSDESVVKHIIAMDKLLNQMAMLYSLLALLQNFIRKIPENLR